MSIIRKLLHQKLFLPPLSRRISITSPRLFTDHYSTLGLSKDVTSKQIKDKYYQLAKKYHPDSNKEPGAVNRFKEISEAYQILGDPSKRNAYDNNKQPFQSRNSQYTQQGPFQDFTTMDPFDLFRMFTEGFTSNTSNNGFPSQFTQKQIIVELSFEEAALGVTRTIEAMIPDVCGVCNGTKYTAGSIPRKCTRCNGSGFESNTSGAFFIQFTCAACNGTKYQNVGKCIECSGRGLTLQNQRITVSVPPGISGGEIARVPTNSKRNEIFVSFKVIPSDYFQRDQFDVISTCTISLAQAALGGRINIKGIYQTEKLTIPSGCSSHSTIRLRNKGIRSPNGRRYGDHIINVKVNAPKALSVQQRRLMEEYASLESREGNVLDENASSDENPGILARIKRAIFG